LSRKGPVKKRDVLPDTKYNDKIVAKFINQVMWDGKKTIAEKIVYGSFEFCAEKSNRDALDCFEIALENVKPKLEVKARRVGGATYQVPIDVREDRSITLAIRWIVNSARKRAERNMENKLANEILDAMNNTGSSVKKKEETHKMAEANKAFAHYKW
jgi:small subunit ribosomal protein S7